MFYFKSKRTLSSQGPLVREVNKGLTSRGQIKTSVGSI